MGLTHPERAQQATKHTVVHSQRHRQQPAFVGTFFVETTFSNHRPLLLCLSPPPPPLSILSTAIFLSGDSLTRQLALTLGAVLGAELVKTEKFASDLFVACGGDLRVRHYRNDLLDTRNQSFPTEHCVEPDYGSTRCTSFAGRWVDRGEEGSQSSPVRFKVQGCCVVKGFLVLAGADAARALFGLFCFVFVVKLGNGVRRPESEADCFVPR